jgi:hypothetical protein
VREPWLPEAGRLRRPTRDWPSQNAATGYRRGFELGEVGVLVEVERGRCDNSIVVLELRLGYLASKALLAVTLSFIVSGCARAGRSCLAGYAGKNASARGRSSRALVNGLKSNQV